jgi:hypothetical protein
MKDIDPAPVERRIRNGKPFGEALARGIAAITLKAA